LIGDAHARKGVLAVYSHPSVVIIINPWIKRQPGYCWKGWWVIINNWRV